MKKLFTLMLAALMLLGCLPTASAAGNPQAYYIVAQAVVECAVGEKPLGSSTDADLEGMMAIMMTDDSAGDAPQIIVIGPEGAFTLWELPNATAQEMLDYFVRVLERWTPFGYDAQGYDFSIIYLSESLSGGSLVIDNQEVAQLVIDAANGKTQPTSAPRATVAPTAAPTATPRKSRPIVPSIMAFADYRITEEERNESNWYYAVRKGLKNHDVKTALAESYVDLLTSKYPFTLVETVDDGGSYYYLLDYTGAGNVRPIVVGDYSADLIVRIYDMAWLDVYLSTSFEYLETDDRTTVNLR